jgi:hypothetical protein
MQHEIIFSHAMRIPEKYYEKVKEFAVFGE